MIDHMPPPKSLIDRIREMVADTSLLLLGANPDSVKVTVSSVAKNLSGRQYKTAKVDGGVRVWRLPDIETSQKESKHVTSKKG